MVVHGLLKWYRELVGGVKDMKNHKNKNLRKGLSLTFNKEQDKIMQFKNKNIRIKNKNTRCARQMWKRIFIILTYTNMNMKKTW